MDVQAFLLYADLDSFRYITKNYIVQTYHAVFSFLVTYILILRAVAKMYIPTKTVEGSFPSAYAPAFLHYFLYFLFFIIVIMLKMGWRLSIDLICLFMMPVGADHLFRYLFTICTSSFLSN